jgi:hypothetical protein
LAITAISTDVLRDAYSVIAGFRPSLEFQSERSGEVPADLRDFLLGIESARITLAGALRASRRHEFATVTIQLRGFRKDLDFLVRLSGFRAYAHSTHLRQIGPMPRDRGRGGPFGVFFEREQRLTVADAVDALVAFFNDAPKEITDVSPQQELLELEKMIPDQRVAPLQFEIRNGVLSLATTAGPLAADASNVESASDELRRQGDSLLDQLKNSNCDRRLIDGVTHVHSQLQDDLNPVKLGLSNMHCSIMCEAFNRELPDAVASMLQAYTRGIDLLVSQFPEWNRFIENAASAHITANHVDLIEQTATRLIEDLERTSETVVDPKVPRSLVEIRKFLRKPGEAGLRGAFAVLRSLENFFSKVLAECVRGAEETLRKTVDGLSSAVSKALIVLAITGAISLSPIASAVPELGWLKVAIEVLQKYIR